MSDERRAFANFLTGQGEPDDHPDPEAEAEATPTDERQAFANFLTGNHLNQGES